MEKKEEKKKSNKRKVWIISGGIVLGLGIIVGTTLYIRKKMKSVVDEKDFGNLLKDGSVVELENGRKEFVTSIDDVGFLNEGDTDGVWIDASGFVKGIRVEDLESSTGNNTFRIRPGQEMLYRVQMENKGFLRQLRTGFKLAKGFIKLKGKSL